MMLNNSCVEELKARKYDVVKFLGRGGFGSCWLVHSSQYDFDFVCKIITNTDLSPAFMISYKREVDSLIQFDHSNIVKVYDVFSSETEMFIILEYCSGGSLESIVKSGQKITPKVLFQYCKEISDAIYYIHSNGYAHCDIKPSNILLDQFGHIKLADFGLCCPCDDTTTKKQYCGSLSFMSPESLVGKSSDPFKNDVWAFGVTLYYIIKRKLPFKGDNLPDLLRDIDLGYELPSSTPFQIRDLIDQCLIVDPIQRPTMITVRNYIIEHSPEFSHCRSKSFNKCLVHCATRTILERSGRIIRNSCSSLY